MYQKHEKRVNFLLNNESFKLKPHSSTLKEYLSQTDCRKLSDLENL